MIRIIIFLFTNLSVMLIFGLILSFTSIDINSLYGLMIISGCFGFSGSLISLFMSKWIALYSVGGQIISKPSNPNEEWLMNIVKKHADKMGIMTPEIAIYPALDINAFATGHSKNSALIAISLGLLKKMNLNEAEAVIAHEMCHIYNGDMITMTLIQGVINTIVIFTSRVIAKIISTNFISNKEENENNQTSMIYFIISTILDILFGILANIIVLWFSRNREFYADAGSAKLVGKYKMIAALEKLKTSYEPEEPNNIIAFCINGKSSAILKLFRSHPSLEQRITALYNEKYM
ncbi:Protease HtpX [Buchnera aphidicola (Eriosoma grossulariae)]|uniref:protease HtpX n=1 Tax=Buchnera aphidicola TaxID=9 RepID=UPI0034645564